MATNNYFRHNGPEQVYARPHVNTNKSTIQAPLISSPMKDTKFSQSLATSPTTTTSRSKRLPSDPPPYSDHGIGSILCGICRKTFHPSRPEALLAHLAGHFDMAYDFHRCRRCDLNFVSEADLRRHMSSATRNSHCGFIFEHKQPCSGHHPPRYKTRHDSGIEDNRRYSLMRHSDDARFDFCYRLRNWEQLQLQSFYHRQHPQPVFHSDPPKKSRRWSLMDACRVSFLHRPRSSSSLRSNAPLMRKPTPPESTPTEFIASNTDVLGAMLLRAVCTGNFELVASLVYAGANIHLEDTFGFGPMHYAARYASPAVVRLLARAGPYINKPDDSGLSPLFHAVKIGRSDIVACFLDLGAELHFHHLELSVLSSDSETAEVLLEHWTQSNKPLDSLDVLLLAATKHRDKCMVEMLLAHGARALARDGNENTAVGVASAKGDREIVQLLFDYGAEPEGKMLRDVGGYRHIALVEKMLLAKGR